MRGKVVHYLVTLTMFVIILNQVTSRCLYPGWSIVCQKYCLDNKFYKIQVNHCWNEDPHELRCMCNNQEFVETIKAKYGLGEAGYYLLK